MKVSIDAWLTAIQIKFRKPLSIALAQLENLTVSYEDVLAGIDIRSKAMQKIRLAREAGETNMHTMLTRVWHMLYPGLRYTVIEPPYDMTTDEFITHMDQRYNSHRAKLIDDLTGHKASLNARILRGDFPKDKLLALPHESNPKLI